MGFGVSCFRMFTRHSCLIVNPGDCVSTGYAPFPPSTVRRAQATSTRTPRVPHSRLVISPDPRHLYHSTFPFSFFLSNIRSYVYCSGGLILTTAQSDPEGGLWRDPPGYFDDIVYPAYVRAHQDIFEAGDVEHGAIKPASTGSEEEQGGQGGPVKDLLLFECTTLDMEEIFDRACEAVWEASQP